jgi:hypothetical protein
MSFKLKTLILIIFSSLILFACGGDKQEEFENINNTTTNSGIDSSSIFAQHVFNSIPARDEIIKLIKEANSEYNVALLNNPDDVNKYLIESRKALNLGVYGTDLNVASIYEQHQESMLFFKCINILAKSIGVSNSFNENMGDRMNANQANRDSTLIIINQAFKSADKTLRDNGRPGTSALLIAGAWIEGIYVACQTAKEINNKEMIQAIFNQKESLNYLIQLLETSNLEVDIKNMLSDLQSIKTIMETKNDDLKELDQKITTLRTNIISTK